MAAPPPVGSVRVSSVDPPLSVLCLLGEDRPDVSSGYGGWDEVVRPRRPPITTFRAPPGLHLTLSLLLDEFITSTSVEAQIAQLQLMARPVAADGATPRVKIAATGSAIPYTDRTWIVGELTWGDAEMNTRGNRTRQAMTLVLYEYVEDVYLTEKSAAQRRRAKAKAQKSQSGAQEKRVKAKAKSRTAVGASTFALANDFGGGEDLLSIAARELGDANRWLEIAQLNGMRDPRAVTIGQVIRLP